MGWAELAVFYGVYQPGATVNCGKISGNGNHTDCVATVILNQSTFLFVPVFTLFDGPQYDVLFSHIQYNHIKVNKN